MQEIRCEKCNKLLAKLDIDQALQLQGKVEIKCPRCGTINKKP